MAVLAVAAVLLLTVPAVPVSAVPPVLLVAMPASTAMMLALQALDLVLQLVEERSPGCHRAPPSWWLCDPMILEQLHPTGA